MKRALLLAGLLGCAAPPPAPDELALERYENAGRLYAAGRYAEAVADYEAVVAERDLLRDAWWRLADCYERTGYRAAAARTLRRWLGVQPSDVDARRRLDALGG